MRVQVAMVTLIGICPELLKVDPIFKMLLMLASTLFFILWSACLYRGVSSLYYSNCFDEYVAWVFHVMSKFTI